MDGHSGYTFLYITGGKWEWSWTINQEARTSDYRRRVHELRKKGYTIIAFHVSDGNTRHGYILVSEPAQESEAA